MKYYTLEDFDNIQKDESYINYKNPELIQLLEKLSSDLGISTHTNTHTSIPTVNSNGHSYRRHGHGHGHGKRITEDSWIQPKVVFKQTTIEKDKNTAVNDIRTCLNKLSAKNYDASKKTILDTIRKTSQQELPTVAQHIFEIASTNKFFSEIYADIYKAILLDTSNETGNTTDDDDFVFLQTTNIFKTLLDTFLENFTETMHTIKYVDASENYDEFCNYNKRNDKRKATSLFIVNLTKKGVIENDVFVSIVVKILEIVEAYMMESGRVNEVEEITENLFLFLTNSVPVQKTDTIWQSVFDKINVLANLKVKDRASLSSRAIFKYCDIVDKMNK